MEEQNEILREEDVLGLDESVDQIRPVKRSKDEGFFLFTLVVYALTLIVATVSVVVMTNFNK